MRGHRLIALACVLATGTAAATATRSNGPSARLVGQWDGRSLCVTSRPACTDETVRYLIRKDSTTGEAFHIQAYKIVAGKPELMGDIACNFEATRQQLVCPQGDGRWQFRWDGEALLGALLTGDGALFRVIHVQRTPTPARPASP